MSGVIFTYALAPGSAAFHFPSNTTCITAKYFVVVFIIHSYFMQVFGIGII